VPAVAKPRDDRARAVRGVWCPPRANGGVSWRAVPAPAPGAAVRGPGGQARATGGYRDASPRRCDRRRRVAASARGPRPAARHRPVGGALGRGVRCTRTACQDQDSGLGANGTQAAWRSSRRRAAPARHRLGVYAPDPLAAACGAEQGRLRVRRRHRVQRSRLGKDVREVPRPLRVGLDHAHPAPPIEQHARDRRPEPPPKSATSLTTRSPWTRSRLQSRADVQASSSSALATPASCSASRPAPSPSAHRTRATALASAHRRHRSPCTRAPRAVTPAPSGPRDRRRRR
jgi:hypothetical protein